MDPDILALRLESKLHKMKVRATWWTMLGIPLVCAYGAGIPIMINGMAMLMDHGRLRRELDAYYDHDEYGHGPYPGYPPEVY